MRDPRANGPAGGPLAGSDTGATFYTYATPFGAITLQQRGQALTAMAFGRRKLQGENRSTQLTNRAASQLQEYFAGKRRVFDLPLAPAGTAFQQQVWRALECIPYGQTRSYGEVAASIGHAGAARAVGQANNRNPLPIFIPCHRVIAADGSLGGYSFGPTKEGGLKIKRFLLDLEARFAGSSSAGKGKAAHVR